MTKPATIPEANWRSSTFSQSNGGECVQVADGVAHAIPVRDSKTPEGPHLTFPHATFGAFVHAVRRGEFGTS
ncbi:MULTISPECIES: DUF397 domain-containing protein [unclassified Streptomyces]|uniref:DUF397 domain-containing protein n=1 Tax=unclassified Streptomyces TaxID=2593676 RepID=UPI00380CD9F5